MFVNHCLWFTVLHAYSEMDPLLHWAVVPGGYVFARCYDIQYAMILIWPRLVLLKKEQNALKVLKVKKKRGLCVSQHTIWDN